MNKLFITTSIPYVNAKPHIGYSLEAVQTDAFARFHKLLGFDVYFLSGSDENAIKNVEAAEKAGVATQEFVDQNAQAFLDLKKSLNLTFDQFIRTSSQKHFAGAQKFWEACQQNNPDDIYKKTYEGLYCVGCETFYKDGEFESNVCPTHNRKLELVQEENWFFRLSKYKDILKEKIESKELEILPQFRVEEVLHMLEDIEDISISRPKERTKGWGIPVPGDPSQHIYVWFDALTNYITALDYPTGELFNKFWLENENRNHVIGKDIVKFHAIYWPAMLLSANTKIPKRIFVHGFVTSEGKKISKTLGNVIDPFELVEQYGVDAVRYYLLREVPSLDDGDFSHHRMQQVYSDELANELGNSVLRVATLAEKDGLTVENTTSYSYDEELIALLQGFRFDHVLEKIWTEVKALNKSIDEFAPWKKSAEERKGFLTESLNTLHSIAWKLQPFLPETAEKILAATAGQIHKIEPLFPKK